MAFGKAGGDFLKEKLHGKGTVWAFRGVPGVGEEVLRYQGFKDALKGTDIKIGAEVYADWNYAKAKQLCARTSSPPVSRSTASGSPARI